jgi:uncharacterized protein (DUF2062 family)
MRHGAPLTRKGRIRRLWHVSWKAVRGVVLLEDTPYRIAMGAAAGIFSSVLPTLGQTFIGMILAKMLRGSVIASLPWSWLSNPFTTLPIWYGCYRVGLLVTGGERMSFHDVTALFTRFLDLPWREALSHGFTDLGGIFLPTLLGSLMIGAGAAALGYVAIHWAVVRLHARRAERRAGWARTHVGEPRPSTPVDPPCAG